MKIVIAVFIISLVATVAFFAGTYVINKPEPIIAQPVIPSPIKRLSPIPVSLDSNVLWTLVQEWRTANNRKPYIKDEKLCEIARIRVQESIENFSHDGFKNRFWNQISYNVLGENLAKDFEYESYILQEWLMSESHLENLQLPFTHSCIACEGDSCTQIFARY